MGSERSHSKTPEELVCIGREVRFSPTNETTRLMLVDWSGGASGDKPGCWVDVSHVAWSTV